MKLWNFAWGPYPRRLTLYLREKPLPIECHEVEFPHRPELWPPGFLRSLNPAHSLPVLETDTGQRIGQSLAILEYLEECFPSPSLLGASPEARARCRELLAVFDEAASYFGLWARQGSRVNAGRHVSNPEAAAFGAERYFAKLQVAEQLVEGGPYLCGASVTTADVVAMALMEFTSEFYGVPMPDSCPRLAAWYEAMSERPTVDLPPYPKEMLELANGLPEQSGFQEGARRWSHGALCALSLMR